MSDDAEMLLISTGSSNPNITDVVCPRAVKINLSGSPEEGIKAGDRTCRSCPSFMGISYSSKESTHIVHCMPLVMQSECPSCGGKSQTIVPMVTSTTTSYQSGSQYNDSETTVRTTERVFNECDKCGTLFRRSLV